MKLHAVVTDVHSTYHPSALDEDYTGRAEVTLSVTVDAKQIFVKSPLVLEMPASFQAKHFPLGMLIHLSEISTELP